MSDSDDLVVLVERDEIGEGSSTTVDRFLVRAVLTKWFMSAIATGTGTEKDPYILTEDARDAVSEEALYETADAIDRIAKAVEDNWSNMPDISADEAYLGISVERAEDR